MPPRTIKCRQAIEHDIHALARIRASDWGTQEYWQCRIADYMNGTLHPQHALKPRIVYVAEDAGAIVGFIAGHLTRRFECDGELEWINVVKERRGSGVAAELLRMLAEWFAAQNALRICVDVSPDNIVARHFYSQHGAIDLRPSWMVWNDIRNVRAEKKSG